MEDDRRELQLLPTSSVTELKHPNRRSRYSQTAPWPSDSTRYRSDNIQFPLETATTPSLDLQLSISLRPIQPPADQLKWQAADEVRIAAMEKAYAERVREMTKREMELAQSEFSRARHMWQRAREEVERVEKMKERAIRRIDSDCMEITCQACRQTFRH